ncbi:MAG: 2,4-dichlorophenol 6-monooxygenase, partial [Mesorhizobium sp.]
SSYGVANMIVNRYRWLSNTPRAHITNQRTMEVLRDLGPNVEAEAMMHASPQELMGENVFCESLAGEELGRMKSWGTAPLSKAEHLLSSPCLMNDLPQTFMEPILFKSACARGTQARMSTEYVSHVQDAGGVTTTCRDRLSGKHFTVQSKFLVGADGGNSLVAEHLGLPLEGKMGVGGSMNILFRADLSKYVAHRPSVLYWVMQPGADVGGIGMGLVRMVRPWDEWLIVWGYDINQPPPEVTPELATSVARQLVGDPALEIELLGANTWTVNNCFATHMHKGRVFIMGDAAHRHPPSNGLGSNTSIQDGFNLAWKLAKVVKEQAGLGLLDSYSPAAEAQREALRKAIAFKKYEFDAHGIEMNQRYVSGAVVTDSQGEPAFEKDRELHYAPTTWPGARLPHVWVFERSGRKVSTLDLCGHGEFTLLTGIGGEPWVAAAEMVGAELGLPIRTHVIGPRRAIEDHGGDWADAREVRDAGCLIVRPDHHVAWRSRTLVAHPAAELRRVFKSVLAR